MKKNIIDERIPKYNFHNIFPCEKPSNSLKQTAQLTSELNHYAKREIPSIENCNLYIFTTFSSILWSLNFKDFSRNNFHTKLLIQRIACLCRQLFPPYLLVTRVENNFQISFSNSQLRVKFFSLDRRSTDHILSFSFCLPLHESIFVIFRKIY